MEGKQSNIKNEKKVKQQTNKRNTNEKQNHHPKNEVVVVKKELPPTLDDFPTLQSSAKPPGYF